MNYWCGHGQGRRTILKRRGRRPQTGKLNPRLQCCSPAGSNGIAGTRSFAAPIASGSLCGNSALLTVACLAEVGLIFAAGCSVEGCGQRSLHRVCVLFRFEAYPPDAVASTKASEVPGQRTKVLSGAPAGGDAGHGCVMSYASQDLQSDSELTCVRIKRKLAAPVG